MASDHLTLRAGEARLDAYLADLAARLRGPRRRREQILAELRDGLDHAVTDHTTAGLPEDQAVTAAIAQFGAPQAVAEAFADELATAYARRTIAWYIVTGPLVGIWWLLLLQPHPWRTGLIALLAAIPVIPLIIIAVATAAGTFATTGSLMRWLPEASPQHALAAAMAIAALALAGDVTVIVTYARSDIAPHSLAVFSIAASLTRIACSLVTMRHAAAMHRAIGTASGPTRGAPAGHGGHVNETAGET